MGGGKWSIRRLSCVLGMEGLWKSCYQPLSPPGRYLVDVRWMKQWKKYVGYDQWDQSNAGLDSSNPGPIDNSNLFKGESHHQPRYLHSSFVSGLSICSLAYMLMRPFAKENILLAVSLWYCLCRLLSVSLIVR